MNALRHFISILCLIMAVVSAWLTGQRHFSKPEDQLSGVVFCAVVLLAGIGVLGFFTQFFAKRTSRVLFSIFFGFLASLMATNFICEVISGTTFSSLGGYMANYGLMLLFVCLAVIGSVLVQISDSNEVQNKKLQAKTAPGD